MMTTYSETTGDMPATEMLLADLAIRQLHARYLDAVWAKNAGAHAGCFARDGVWRIAGTESVGREAIAATFARLTEPAERVLMLLGLPILTFGAGATGGEIVGRIHVTEIIKHHSGATVRTIGLYHDRYFREEGDWRFAERNWEMFYRGPADFSSGWQEPEWARP